MTIALQIQVVPPIEIGAAESGIGITEQAVGFTLTGGTIPKTLTVPLNATVAGSNTGDETKSTIVEKLEYTPLSPLELYDAKTTPDNTDKLLLEEAAPENTQKKFTWSNLMAALGSVFIKKTGNDSDIDLGNYNLVSGGYVSGKKSGVFAYITEQAATTIATADTWYPVLGTFVNYPLENFSAASVYTPGIKYDGAVAQWFKIDWHASIIVDRNSTTVSFGVKKNNEFVVGSDMDDLCKTAGEIYSLGGSAVISLAQNDEIQLVITSDADGDVIIVHKYTVTINEFFD